MCFVIFIAYRLTIIGDYNKHECAIRLNNASEADSGVWKCDVEEYVSRINVFTTANKASHLFQVVVVKNKTDNSSNDVSTRFGHVENKEGAPAEKHTDEKEPLDVEK
jgi:hypothetical protein